MLKRATVVGLTGLMFGVSPAAAGSTGDGETVVLTMVGGGGLLSIGCMAIALLTQDEEDEEEGYDRRGFYAGLSGSYVRENFSDSTVVNLIDGELQEDLRNLRGTPTGADPGAYTFSLDNIDDDGFGVSGRVGYRCHPHVSAELQFDWMENWDGMIAENGMPMNDTARNFQFELETLVFTTNVKGHLLTGRYQPYVLLGLGFMRTEIKTRDISGGAIPGFAAEARERKVNVAGRFGGGLDFYLTENVVVTAEGSYLMPAGKLDGLDYYTFGLGLQYRF
jgi:opacity protein-like surface antigen